jgi:hypothetical protein
MGFSLFDVGFDFLPVTNFDVISIKVFQTLFSFPEGHTDLENVVVRIRFESGQSEFDGVAHYSRKVGIAIREVANTMVPSSFQPILASSGSSDHHRLILLVFSILLISGVVGGTKVLEISLFNIHAFEECVDLLITFITIDSTDGD